MRGLALTVSILCAGGAGGAWYTRQAPSEWRTARASYERECERSRQLEDLIERRRACAAYCNRQMTHVVMGVTHLSNACDNIHAYAAVHYPPYLEQVNVLGRGRTLREKLAHCLVATCFVRRGPDDEVVQAGSPVALRLAVELAHVSGNSDHGLVAGD